MSHRIIIQSSRSAEPVGAMRVGATDLHEPIEQGSSIEININYAPSHGETDKQTLSRVGKLLKLMRKMEDTIVSPETNGEHEE